MKIGILTLVPYDNYGGILQGYALQTVLERMGHEVFIMNTKLYNYVRPKVRLRRNIEWFLRKKILNRENIQKFSPYECDKLQSYRVSELKPFNDKYIHFTRTFKNGKADIGKFAMDKHFNAFVVGSDQTWKPGLSPDLYHMFCDFLPANANVKRIAYAASFGDDKLPLNAKQLHVCKPLLQKFDFVGIREASGVELCKQFFGIKAEQVLDPTLLLEKDDYLELIRNYKPKFPDVELMQYVFFWKHEEKLVIDKISYIIKAKPTNVFPEKFLFQLKNRKELPLSKFLPLEEWIYAYNHSRFVVTDSFHGAVFCIIFNKPFIVVSPESSTRFKSLLGLFGLEDRMVMKASEVTRELVNAQIDWNTVNARKEELKTKSMNMLRNALES